MLSALAHAGVVAPSDDRYVVRYNGRNGHVWVASLFFVTLFSALLALYLDDDWRRLIFSRNTQNFKPFSWGEVTMLFVFVVAALYDLVMTLVRCRPGEVALAINSDGITCLVMHRRRLIPWHDLAAIEEDGKYLTLRRHPRSLLQKIFTSRRHGAINLRLSSIDHDADEIIAMIHRADPNWHA